jgi:hypothetical protein
MRRERIFIETVEISMRVGFFQNPTLFFLKINIIQSHLFWKSNLTNRRNHAVIIEISPIHEAREGDRELFNLKSTISPGLIKTRAGIEQIQVSKNPS